PQESSIVLAIGSGLSLRGLCWLFSLVSFVVMAANNQGDGQNFDQYQEYQLCLIYFLLALLE
ncbi:CASP domain-containing protein, partial [Serratia marcescens]|uniref:CASP domain-containing protein n=1 Tax=Serratia marcescens TaxID=615 RepID=UPI0013DA4278